MKITLEEMENAVEYLAMTDSEYARAKSYYEGLSEQKKIVKAQAFLRSSQSAQTAKEQDAYASQIYREHIAKMEAAHLEYLTIEANRQTATIKIDCWRSLNAARNRGQFM
jgi:hypothetical protein